MGPVVLQLVQQDTAAAAEAAAIKSELLASCIKIGTLEQQLQLEAGSSTSNLTLCVRNDCGELLNIRAIWHACSWRCKAATARCVAWF